MLCAMASMRKYAFAFGIDLQSQLATVQFEDRQIMRRSLDGAFPSPDRLFAGDISDGACIRGSSR
jgi:hypothetical protein